MQSTARSACAVGQPLRAHEQLEGAHELHIQMHRAVCWQTSFAVGFVGIVMGLGLTHVHGGLSDWF